MASGAGKNKAQQKRFSCKNDVYAYGDRRRTEIGLRQCDIY